MENNFSYQITRDIPHYLYDEIMKIRQEHYYHDAFDVQYWNGGIQNVLDSFKLKYSHAEDSSSTFLLIFDSSKSLVAYSRFSLNEKFINQYRISKLHIFITKKELIGREILIDKGLNKAGVFMLDKIIEECTNQGSDILISEISVFPVPNLPSLILHKMRGFQPITNSLKSIDRIDNIANSFIILGKYLSNKARIQIAMDDL